MTGKWHMFPSSATSVVVPGIDSHEGKDHCRPSVGRGRVFMAETRASRRPRIEFLEHVRVGVTAFVRDIIDISDPDDVISADVDVGGGSRSSMMTPQPSGSIHDAHTNGCMPVPLPIPIPIPIPIPVTGPQLPPCVVGVVGAAIVAVVWASVSVVVVVV